MDIPNRSGPPHASDGGSGDVLDAAREHDPALEHDPAAEHGGAHVGAACVPAVLLERANRLEPGKGSIVEALGRAYYNSGQHERAADVFGELLEIDPSAAYGHYARGQALKQVGRRTEARTHLRLACALAPESALYRAALARLG